MRARRQKNSAASKIAILCWCAVFLAALFIYWRVMTNTVIRDFWDPQYSRKHTLLHDRLAENPGRPLWLIMGTSRVDDGLRPDLIKNKTQSGESPLIFNFGMSGADSFRQYICVKRLLDEGIRPQRVGIEILAPLLSQKESMFVSSPSLVVRARRNELDTYCRFTKSPGKLLGIWRESRNNPFYKWGFKSDGQTMPPRQLLFPLSIAKEREASSWWNPWGWMKRVPMSVTAEEYRREFEHRRGEFEPMLKDFEVTPESESTLDELLNLCAKSGVEVFIFQMPEGADFQQLYPEQANREIAAFLDRLKKRHGVQIIDARAWIETEDFRDGHHLTATGAEKFTKQFAGELFKTAR